MNTVSKIILGVIILAFMLGWFLFRPGTDEIHANDSRIGMTLTFDTPMVYITNCSQCSLSPRAQNTNVFLVPQTFLYNTTGFLDEDSIVSQVGIDSEFTVQEVFTNYPHGLDTAFRRASTYMVVVDQQGFTSVVYEDIDKIIEFDANNDTRETRVNSRLIRDVQNKDVFWISVELNPRLFGDFSSTPLPDNVEERERIVASIENEFLGKLTSDQMLQYKLDKYHPRVYIQMDKKDILLYIQAEQTRLNVRSISLYKGDDLEGTPFLRHLL